MRCAQRADILAMPAACLPLECSGRRAVPVGAARKWEWTWSRPPRWSAGSTRNSFRFVTCRRRIFWDRGGGEGVQWECHPSLSVAVVRSCITKGDHHAPLQRRLFSPPPSPLQPRVTKKRSVQSTSPLLRVALPLLLATDIQIKEPPPLHCTYPPRIYVESNPQSGEEVPR